MEVKELKFETSKGTFLLVDMVGKTNKSIPWDFVEKSYTLKNITEDEANEIVDKVMQGQHFQNYAWEHIVDRWVKSGVESLLSLMKYLGVELYENPYKDHEDKDLEWFYEECTFYSPVILKLYLKNDRTRNT